MEETNLRFDRGLGVQSESLLRRRHHDDWCWRWRLWLERHGRYPRNMVALESSQTTSKEEIHPEGINPRFSRGLIVHSDSLLHCRCHHGWCWLWRYRFWLERLLRSPIKRVASEISRKSRREEIHPEGTNLRFARGIGVHSKSLLRQYQSLWQRWRRSESERTTGPQAKRGFNPSGFISSF